MSLFTREMACQELVELVTGYFDGSLSRSDRRRFRAHISGFRLSWRRFQLQAEEHL